MVAPCYEEAEGLAEFYLRGSAVCREVSSCYEIVLVNDGSADNTWPLIRSFAEQIPMWSA